MFQTPRDVHDLSRGAGADQCGREFRTAQVPGDRHLCECLTAAFRKSIQCADLAEDLRRDRIRMERAARACPRVRRDAVQITVRQHTLIQRGVGDGADAFFPEHFKESLFLVFAVEHIVPRLMDQAWGAEFPQDCDCPFGNVGGGVGDPRVQSASAAYNGVECAHGFLQRRVRVRAVVIEDVHIVQSHAFETLITAGDERLPGSPFPVGTVPHEESRLAGDHEFIAVRSQIRCHDASEIFLGGAGDGTVVVGEIEMGDSEVECCFHHGDAVFLNIDRTEILP